MITLSELNLSKAELDALVDDGNREAVETAIKTKPRKFKNIPQSVDGIPFASGAEARRYCELRALEQSGEISELKWQVTFELQGVYSTMVNGRRRRMRAIKYIADFTYREPGFAGLVVEDVKGDRVTNRGKRKGTGTRTAVFSIKERLFRKAFPYPEYDFRIVRM